MKTLSIAMFTWFVCVGLAHAQDVVHSKSCWDPSFSYEMRLCSESLVSPEFAANLTTAPGVFSLVPEPRASYPQSSPPESRNRPPAFRLGVSYDYMRFRSSVFNANVNGVRTSFSYSWKDWLGVEGDVLAAFGSSTLNNQSSHIVLYGAGPRLATNTGRFQPWAHALAGGIHVYPQVGSNLNGFAFQLGGGVDYAYKPFLSFRVESDYVRSQLYSAGQNSFTVGGGVVIPF